MPIPHSRLVAATSLLALSLPAVAGTATAEAYLITRNADNIITNTSACTTGSTTFTDCIRIVEDVGLGSPLTTTGTLTALRSTFDNDNGTGVPNFVLNGTASASASFGHLHASTFVQIQGKGGDNVSAGGRATAVMNDRVIVKSSVLPVGTPVTVKVTMDVSGHGGGVLYLGIKGGGYQRVSQATDSGYPPDVMEDYETTFSAKVGDYVNVRYGLLAYTRVVATLWRPIDVLNGRNNRADYGSSAYIYMGGLDAAQGITLQSDSGYVYAVSAVPEPDAAWLLLAGLPLLAWRARRASQDAPR